MLSVCLGLALSYVKTRKRQNGNLLPVVNVVVDFLDGH